MTRNKWTVLCKVHPSSAPFLAVSECGHLPASVLPEMTLCGWQSSYSIVRQKVESHKSLSCYRERERDRERDRDRERQRHGQTDRRREINLTCRHFWVQTAFQRFQWLFSSVKRRAVPCAPHTWGRCFALQHYVYCYHVRTQTQALPDRVILSVIHRAERSIRACSWQTCSDFRIPDILVLRV